MVKSGLLVLNKETGPTSHKTIESLRKILHFQKIGHLGTLDPQVSGVLLACLGKATRLSSILMNYEKEYRAVIKLGEKTTTGDVEGETVSESSYRDISEKNLREVISSFQGTLKQKIPVYSAAKYKGRKFYEYARAGKEIPARTKKVEIKEIEILSINLPFLEIKVSCSKGTYMRSLAEEIGEKLNCGGHLYSLSRTRVGPFEIEEALTLKKVSELYQKNLLENKIYSVEAILEDFPYVRVRAEIAAKIKTGPNLTGSDIVSLASEIEKDSPVKIVNEKNQVLALGKLDLEGLRHGSNPKKIFEYLCVIGD